MKSTSYWQSWKALDANGNPKDLTKFPPKWDDKIRFAAPRAKDAIDHHKERVPRFKSEVYVLCFQKHDDYPTWDAMNLEQWEFTFKWCDPAARFSNRLSGVKVAIMIAIAEGRLKRAARKTLPRRD